MALKIQADHGGATLSRAGKLGSSGKGFSEGEETSENILEMAKRKFKGEDDVEKTWR